MRALVAAVAACVALLAASMALGAGAASFSDGVGDDNAAPDITAVSVSEASEILTLRVTVRNYQVLPDGTWFNIWFDLDRNAQTGDIAGDESMVRFFENGDLEHYVWNGSDWVAAPATGVTGAYSAGVLTVTLPKSLLGSSSFGILAVGARGQQLSGELFVSADLAPNSGRLPFTSPMPGDFPDPVNDHSAAPDIAQVRVTDAKNGWVKFAVSTPNRVTLPGQSVLVLSIDRDANPRTGASGSEVSITDLGGEISLLRFNARTGRWSDDRLPTRLKESSGRNVVTIEVHRSELDNTPRFGFKLASADLDTATGDAVAIDFAPDSGRFWRYTLANPVAVRLLAAKPSGLPPRPRAGRPFLVKQAVKRADTSSAITSGTVTCTATLGGRRLAAKGSLVRGVGRCSMRIPAGASGKRLRGTLTVRLLGSSLTSTFTYVVG